MLVKFEQNLMVRILKVHEICFLKIKQKKKKPNKQKRKKENTFLNHF